MPTVAAHNNVATTDAPQVLDTRGASNMEITISDAAVYIAFAPRIGGIRGGSFGLEELHGPKLLNISNEPIDSLRVRSAAEGIPATVTVIATT